MRSGLFVAAAAALLATPVVALAADPPVVFQTQPVGKLLDDLRAVGSLLGGDAAVKELNDNIKRNLGEKGFDGLDLTRPIVGYVMVPADVEQFVVVVVLPATGEKEFLDLCERANKQKPKPLPGGLYELPPADLGVPGIKAAMRFADGSAYVAAGKDPAPALAPKALLPVGKLFDPAERAQLSGKVYFDRLPKDLRAKLGQGIDDLKKQIGSLPAQLGPDVNEAVKGVIAEFTKLGTRYLDEIKDADTATGRVSLEPGNAEAAVELALTGKAGTALAKDIAGRKPTTNRFAGLVTRDTAVGFKTRLPLFAPELRAAAALGLEAGQKYAAKNPPPVGAGAVDELFKGLIRTVKTGEFDLAGGVRGPNTDGTFTAVGAVAFEDTKPLEKELRGLVAALPPLKDMVVLDAAKVGEVSIHEVKVAGQMPAEMKKVFGEGATVALAFAPKGILVAVGSDAVNVVKEALALKPAPAPVMDVTINPARMAKLVTAFGGNATDITDTLGSGDAPVSVSSLSVDGGKELRVRFALNLRVFPGRAWASSKPPPAPPTPGIKK